MTIAAIKVMTFKDSSLLLLFSRVFGETITRAASARFILNEDALFNKIRDIAYRSRAGTPCDFLPFFCGKVSFETRKQFVHNFMLPIIQDERLVLQTVKKGLFFQGAFR